MPSPTKYVLEMIEANPPINQMLEPGPNTMTRTTVSENLLVILIPPYQIGPHEAVQEADQITEPDRLNGLVRSYKSVEKAILNSLLVVQELPWQSTDVHLVFLLKRFQEPSRLVRKRELRKYQVTFQFLT
jgi:hypothetical protein